ncbi:MAG: hypothetical protein CME68_05515 [Halobacteriovoraceae bacterium]|nr:hypothetical protein [Halobacteriovoraceae bacterium]
MKEEKKSSFKQILLIGSPLFIGLLIFLFWFIQETVDQATFIPSDQNFKFCPELKKRGFATKEEEFKGQNLRYYKMKTENAKATLIFFHGSGRSACENREILSNLEGLPLNIIITEYPGYGRDLSGETPSEKTILLNSLTLAQKIRKNLPKNHAFFVYGASMGTAVATYVASELNLNGLVLRNPMTSMMDTAKILYKKYPSKLIDFFFKKHSFEAFRWAKKVKTNVLILYAEKDDWIPIGLARKQSSHFGKSKVSFHIIEGAGHMDTYAFPKYKTYLRSFILNNISKRL